MSLYDAQTPRRPFKAAVDHSATKKRREEAHTLLRTRRRDSTLLKKRRESLCSDASGADDLMDVVDTPVPSVADLPEMAVALGSDSPERHRAAVGGLRRLLAEEKDPPIDAVVSAGVVPHLVQFLTAGEPELQFEAAWTLTNIASGTSAHTDMVVRHGAVSSFTELLASPSEQLQEQAVWALGNIAGDSAHSRDVVLASAALPALLAMVHRTPSLKVLRQVAWALSNLCRGEPAPDFQKVLPALPTLVDLLSHSDREVATDACWAISHLCDGPSEQITTILQARVVPRLVELLTSPQMALHTPALRMTGNILLGEDWQTQLLINSGCLSAMHALLTHPKKSIRKETCWALSNVTAGTPEQIQATLNANLIPLVLDLLSAGDFEIKTEAAWCITNALAGGGPTQIQMMVRLGCIQPLCDLLVLPDAKLISMALEGLESILKVGELHKQFTNGLNVFAQYIEEAGGLDRVEQLQMHANHHIYEQAIDILERFYEADGLTDDTMLTPARDLANSCFEFSATPPRQFILA